MAQHAFLSRARGHVTSRSARLYVGAPEDGIARSTRPPRSSVISKPSVDVKTAGGFCRPSSADWYSSRDVSDPGRQPRGSFRPRPHGVTHVPAVAVSGAIDPSALSCPRSPSCP
jgi:hypothetical protein